MAYPKKMKGWRTIVVDDRKYLWKFMPGSDFSVLKVRPGSSTGSVIEVKLSDWVDPWINTNQSNAAENDPAMITPSFVVGAIRFALANDWKPETPSSSRLFEFRNNNFIQNK